MKRLFDDNWQRLLLQLGVLGGIALAFAVGGREQDAAAGGNPDCADEADCSYKRPNVLLIVNYSTFMNTPWAEDQTRWEAVVSGVQQLADPGGFLSRNTHLALMRYGHDPDPNNPDTPIPFDNSGLVDGQIIDVSWDDDNLVYQQCNGAEIALAIGAAPAPLDGVEFGIGPWTKGALDRAAAEIAQTKADHPGDADARVYLNVVIGPGLWTSADGLQAFAPAGQNPAVTATTLFDDQSVATYVVGVGPDMQAVAAANELAQAGGTSAALLADSPMALGEALDVLGAAIETEVVAPACSGGLPRVMVLLDASSSMLNIDGGTEAGGMGETGWDQARDALAGDLSMFSIDVGVGDLEDVVHFGLAVWGHNQPDPGEHKILVQYGPCTRDNFAWALDPNTSCEMPGCGDPWGGPQITWTFQDGNQDPPGFDTPTRSHMPKCDGNQAYCAGSGTYTHLGLQLIKDNQIQYHLDGQQPDAPYPTELETPYLNILITDGQYNPYSTDAQVQAELDAMYGAGITTHVIGFGDGVNTPGAIAQLENMADWGSGGLLDYHDADNQAGLEQALTAIVGGVEFDPCCAFNNCTMDPMASGGDEPDPLPPDPVPVDTGDGDGDGDSGDGDGDSGDGDSGDGDGDGDPGDGDGDPGDGDGDTIGDESGDGGGSDSTGADDPGIDGDEGCNCATAGERGDFGPLGGLLLLLGLGSRRRRHSYRMPEVRSGFEVLAGHGCRPHRSGAAPSRASTRALAPQRRARPSPARGPDAALRRQRARPAARR